MAYVGKQPLIGNFIKLDAITTSATATYNLLNDSVAVSPQSPNNCIVSLNGVIQAPTDAYTISGSQIIFDSALTASDTIDFILVLGDVLDVGTVSDDTITTAKIQDSAVTTAKINDLAVTDGKLAGSISNAKLANSAITINGSSVSLGGSITVETGEGAIPTITTSSLIAEPTTDTSLTIAGTNFVSIPKVEFIKTTGAITTAPTVTFASSTSLTVTTGTTLTAGTYYVRVINPDGGTVTTSSALFTVSAAPAWTTAAGSLGSVAGGGSVNFTVVATDATSYAKQSGSFPGGVTINSSTGVISGTETGSTSTTTYTFTIRATDAEAQTSDREFSITISHGLEQGMSFI